MKGTEGCGGEAMLLGRGEFLSSAFLPGKLLNQVEIRTGRELSAITEKLEV